MLSIVSTLQRENRIRKHVARSAQSASYASYGQKTFTLFYSIRSLFSRGCLSFAIYFQTMKIMSPVTSTLFTAPCHLQFACASFKCFRTSRLMICLRRVSLSLAKRLSLHINRLQKIFEESKQINYFRIIRFL